MIDPKVALITGASAGIGEATALEYAKLGYKIAITGRNQERLDKVFRSLISASPNKSSDDFMILQADFERQDEVETVVSQTVSKFGRLDFLINNAGYSGKRRSLEDEDFYDDFQRIMQVNLMAATRIAQLAIPHITKTKGVIINISSIADRLPMPSISYSVSKAGLTMLTKTLANALEGTGVRVVTVSPGPIITNFSPETGKYKPATSLQRVGNANEVANTIVFLTSDKASYIHGCTIDVDGGTAAKYGGIFSRQSKLLE